MPLEKWTHKIEKQERKLYQYKKHQATQMNGRKKRIDYPKQLEENQQNTKNNFECKWTKFFK